MLDEELFDVEAEQPQLSEAALLALKKQRDIIPPEVLLLAMNGFLLVYAFSIETIYAMFMKDNFGYGHATLSTLFAVNGVLVGFLQLVLMRHLVAKMGKHMLLASGNLLLALGMLGLSLVRYTPLHFLLFSVHILGYSMADTALVSLISRYAGSNAQGRSLGLNQAAQSTARVISPLVAGYLYTNSKKLAEGLPPGALPYVVGSVMPLLAIAAPLILYMGSIDRKKRAAALESLNHNGEQPL
ncbi:major facilitator superfamily domain-containing protein [Tribonema minus]|uniref:Major facilitator superfamily domain-containing protein n=1 Tax=Tribonema minus TaxID=303371 RepID=A0A836CM96_9STRA|nr:major facilitator superfamily domain-containing protein [Tribonema minus]